MDLIDEDNLVYPELYYNPEKADEIKDIYDFIERGFAKETYIDFLKF